MPETRTQGAETRSWNRVPYQIYILYKKLQKLLDPEKEPVTFTIGETKTVGRS